MQLLADPIMLLAALVVVLLLCALVWAGSRRPYVREVERLRDDLHNLLSSGEQAERIPVNGRLGAFVDITASMNRLLDRGETETEPARKLRAGQLAGKVHVLQRELNEQIERQTRLLEGDRRRRVRHYLRYVEMF